LIHRFGDCELDEGRFELRRGDVPHHLEPQVFEVLAYLVRNRAGWSPRPSCWTRSGAAGS
jgi:DNA-binding winged helix-turn-helix (wHTH) protein